MTVKTVKYVIIVPAFLLDIKGRRGNMYFGLPTYLILFKNVTLLLYDVLLNLTEKYTSYLIRS